MDSLEEKLENLEKLVTDNTETKDEKLCDEDIDTKEDNVNPQNNDENPVTISDMSYLQVTEMAKKSNLIATAKDKTFIEELSDKNKDVLKSSSDLEREKVEAEKLQIKLEQEKIATEKEKSLNERLKGKFGSKLDEQEYHFKSLKPILETFGIKQAMNIYVMWTISIIGCITLIYPIKLLFCAIFGNLIAGASSENRKGFAKGCLWTAISILGIALTTLIIFGIVKLGQYLFL